MKGQQHDGKADEFAAEAHRPLAQDDDQDTAAAWAAVAAWAITATGPDRREIPAPLDRLSGSAQTPASWRRPAALTLTPANPGHPLAGLPRSRPAVPRRQG